MLHARSYANGGAVECDGNAYTVTSTYNNGNLIMYTTHPTQPANLDSNPSYHMTQLNGWYLPGSREQFVQGVSAFRNARDWTREHRDNAIARANEKANNDQSETPGSESPGLNLLPSLASEAPSQASATSVDEQLYTSDDVVHKSETSVDELAVDLQPPAKRSSRHSGRSHRSRRKRHNRSQSSSIQHGNTSAAMTRS